MDKPNHLNYPNTSEGLAAFDRDMAAYNREQNPLAGKELADNIESTVGTIAQLPVVKQGLEFVGGVAHWVDETMSQDQGVGGQLYRSYQTLKGAGEQQFGNLAESLGVDRRFGTFAGGELVDTLVTAGTASIAGKAGSVINNLPPGSGMTPQLVGAGGGLRLNSNLPSNVSQITVKNPDLIAPGVGPGVAKRPDYQLGVGKLRAQGAADEARRAKYMEQFASGEITKDQLTERLAKIKKRGDAKYSTLATADDPDIFEVRSQQNLDPTNPNVMADQHHATTKAMTTPWVKKALELGDDDDVVALFELHRMLTGSGMGNARSGIIDIPGVVHDTAKAKRAGRDPGQAIHSLFKKSGAGVEIRTDKVESIIGNPKNMDELLENYVTFANEYLIPQKELSLKVLRKELDRHRSTLSGQALSDFDELVKKLNKANTK